MIPTEFKDQVARKYGYEDWNYVLSLARQEDIIIETFARYLEEAGLLYAQSKWDEACEAQKENCLSNIVKTSRVWDYVAGSHKPEFKP